MSFLQYKNMMDAYKSNNEDQFAVAARIWIEESEVNPFKDREPHELYFNAKRYCKRWRAGGIDCRSAKRNMLEILHKIAAMDLGYPVDLIEEEKQKEEDKKYKESLAKKREEKKAKEAAKTEEKKVKEEPKKEKDKLQEVEDCRYVLLSMVKAYNVDDEVNFKQFAIHLMDISEENLFNTQTDEYNKFEEMKAAYARHNMRRLFVVAGQLCEIINNTELENEPKKVVLKENKVVLGVPEEEKKSWLSFLNPWKKEGEPK